MGYLHIDNLYKNQRVLMFKECYALEKVHGTSAHIGWRGGELYFSSGGEKHDRFAALFDHAELLNRFELLGHPDITVYGEAYGGSQQGQSHRYGKELRFVAFDVLVGETWLDVPNAADVAEKLGLRFVDWVRVETELPLLDALRDASSTEAHRNGVEGFQPREGVVLRPLIEVKLPNGTRVIAKHKRDDERETATPRKVVDPDKLEVLQKAEQIATEWVTPTRLAHVLDKMPGASIEQTRDVIAAMVEDVLREGAGELVDSREARAAIGKATAMMFKKRLQAALMETV